LSGVDRLFQRGFRLFETVEREQAVAVGEPGVSGSVVRIGIERTLEVDDRPAECVGRPFGEFETAFQIGVVGVDVGGLLTLEACVGVRVYVNLEAIGDIGRYLMLEADEVG
jgi:hypothetical protein